MKTALWILIVVTIIVWRFDVLDYFGDIGDILWPIVYFILASTNGWIVFRSFKDEKSELGAIWSVLGFIICLLLLIYSVLPNDI